MADPYVGEIKMFAGNFAPAGWAFCNGALLPIAENEALFTLIGTTYGGDGQETFALPDLQCRVPLHRSGSIPIAQMAGVEAVTLTTQQIPVHNHAVLASEAPADQVTAGNNLPAEATKRFYTTAPASPVAMAADAVGSTGGSQPHDNMQPFLAVNFIISLFGVFPNFS